MPGKRRHHANLVLTAVRFKGKEIKIRCEDNFQQWMIARINWHN